MQGSPATQRQIDCILSLAGVSYLSQVHGTHGIYLTVAERKGAISKAGASQVIDQLKKAQK